MYFAGLWGRLLIHKLAWKINDPRSCRRRSPWAAPTFSWASIKTFERAPEGSAESEELGSNPGEGVLNWIRRASSGDVVEELDLDQCKILDMAHVLAGSDPTGQVTNAFLILQGLLYPTVLEGLNKLTTSCHPPHEDGAYNDSEYEYFYADYDYTNANEPQQRIDIGAQLYCFILQSWISNRPKQSDWACSLVLRRVGECLGAEGIFERVGVMVYTRSYHWGLITPKGTRCSRINTLRSCCADGTGIISDAIVKII